MIILCVRSYLRYSLSYRDLEEIMAERGLSVDHVTMWRWGPALCAHFEEEHSSALGLSWPRITALDAQNTLAVTCFGVFPHPASIGSYAS